MDTERIKKAFQTSLKLTMISEIEDSYILQFQFPFFPHLVFQIRIYGDTDEDLARARELLATIVFSRMLEEYYDDTITVGELRKICTERLLKKKK